MIEAFQQNDAQVVLAGMTLPRNYGPEYIHAFEQIYPELAKKYKLVRIPFFLDGVGGNAALTQPDGLHPTEEGAAVVAHTVMRYLQPMLRK
jgi:acyl-CoA thioesterase I